MSIKKACAVLRWCMGPFKQLISTEVLTPEAGYMYIHMFKLSDTYALAIKL